MVNDPANIQEAALKDASGAENVAPQASFATLFRLGAFAAVATIAVTVVQIVLGVAWPPPDFAPTASAATRILEMAQAQPVLTFLKLDGLMILDYVLLVVVFLALYAALRRQNPSLMMLGTVLALVGITLYFTTNPAATMLVLAGHYDATGSALQDAGIVSAGQSALLDFQGTAFLVHYLLMGVAGMIVSAAMLRSGTFSRVTAIAGLMQGAMMMVPVTFGTIGLIFAVGSLVPFVVWFALIALRLRELSSAAAEAAS